MVTIEETIVEVSTKVSPTGERMVGKRWPKDNEPRTLTASQQLLGCSGPESGCRLWTPPGSGFTYGCTSSGTPTRRGYWPAAPIFSR